MAEKPTLVKLKEFFDIDVATFAREWKALSDADKADFRKGMEDGSMTY